VHKLKKIPQDEIVMTDIKSEVSLPMLSLTRYATLQRGEGIKKRN